MATPLPPFSRKAKQSKLHAKSQSTEHLAAMPFHIFHKLGSNFLRAAMLSGSTQLDSFFQEIKKQLRTWHAAAADDDVLFSMQMKISNDDGKCDNAVV